MQAGWDSCSYPGTYTGINPRACPTIATAVVGFFSCQTNAGRKIHSYILVNQLLTISKLLLGKMQRELVIRPTLLYQKRFWVLSHSPVHNHTAWSSAILQLTGTMHLVPQLRHCSGCLQPLRKAPVPAPFDPSFLLTRTL